MVKRKYEKAPYLRAEGLHNLFRKRQNQAKPNLVETDLTGSRKLASEGTQQKNALASQCLKVLQKLSALFVLFHAQNQGLLDLFERHSPEENCLMTNKCTTKAFSVSC